MSAEKLVVVILAAWLAVSIPFSLAVGTFLRVGAHPLEETDATLDVDVHRS